MSARKTTKKYYFTVEGETEKWYLEWLEKQINSNEASLFRVSIVCRICKKPTKGVKTFAVLEKTEIYHLIDYECQEEVYEQNFINTLDNMKEAEKLGKQIKYSLGYSNLTFDLWIILHRLDYNESCSNRSNYIRKINGAFGEKFDSLTEYKEEANFRRCLSKINLADVINAIQRSEIIMQRNKDYNNLYNYKNFEYYRENPSLSVWEPIKKILQDCGMI